MEISYTPGPGLLLGAGSRWLLLGVDGGDGGDGSGDGVDGSELWSLLTAPSVDAAELLARIDSLLGPDVPLAYVDTSGGSGSSYVRGGATVTTSADEHTLALALGPSYGGGSLPLLGGIVRASAAVVAGAVAAGAVAAGAGSHVTRRPPIFGAVATAPKIGGQRVTSVVRPLIDGIPPEILAASAPPPPPAPTGSPSRTGEPPPPGTPGVVHERTVRRAAVDTDHDGETTYRPEVAIEPEPSNTPSPPPGPPAGGHLRQATHETVLAAHCSAGHLTAAFTPMCRVCGAPVPPQDPQRLPRPRLGVLHLPDGEQVPLDRGVVIGRLPAPPPGRSDWPHLVRVPDDATFVSRSHLAVELDGWLVVATDLGSRGGTTLRVPGRPPERIRAHEPYVWEPGQVLDLADSYEIVYEVTP